ncbi:co-chaperone SGT1 NDAI_0H00680 [Naumovozyma dairenensis CBS 421]|uniref:CS domain-containing protein n=1 Tax=Naumovozyma dairenensis (strain ATCC 10597 / BCRC 20456 / CBS 421 / NBRC 0211 / NRRL Y-12639) TaxID=1071378 RepID=G0WEN1_NAUDC|nr:hypothetical protein NDAI_0H00680 [Naumovozyma dairenensis CBS 421]CCD26242.1 hypothetical protein NDAI_0H00680 [Naumovozyma dairenensis CBS 421]
MTIESDLKTAYQTLYDHKNPENALELYNGILEQSPENLNASIYKAASLEKLYFANEKWHNEETIESAKKLLNKALDLAINRGIRSKIGLIYFRFFIHYFNLKKYQDSKIYFDKCKEYDYVDPTLPLWESRLNKKLEKLTKNKGKTNVSTQATTAPTATTKSELKEQKVTPTPTSSIPKAVPAALPEIPQPTKFRTDWYQTPKTVTLSLFTASLPKSKEDIQTTLSSKDKRTLNVSYPIPDTSSEFQYNAKLSHEIDPDAINVQLYSKKMEFTFTKVDAVQWKTLESAGNDDKQEIKQFESTPSTGSSTNLSYPSSSRKQTDWSKLTLDNNDAAYGDNDDDEEGDSADAFFKKLYAGADPETQRAMMKSFIESNGTTLNTNWEEVSKKFVKPAPPEGTELKHW